MSNKTNKKKNISQYCGSRKAVDVRVQRLPKEYKDKAHKTDKIYNSVTDDQVSPVQAKLNTFRGSEVSCGGAAGGSITGPA